MRVETFTTVPRPLILNEVKVPGETLWTAVAEACRLPENPVKWALLQALADAMMVLNHTPFVVGDGGSAGDWDPMPPDGVDG